MSLDELKRKGENNFELTQLVRSALYILLGGGTRDDSAIDTLFDFVLKLDVLQVVGGSIKVLAAEEPVC